MTFDDDPCQPYLEEIEVWKQASRLHAQKAIEQYRRVTENLEAFFLERQRNAAVLDNLSDIVIVFDEQDGIVLWNRAAAHVFELTADQAIGQDFYVLMEVLLPELANWLWTQQHLRAGQPHFVSEFRGEQRFRFGEKQFQAKVTTVVADDHVHWVLLLEDMTELFRLQRLLQEEKMMLERRVEERTRALQDEMQRKQQAQQALEKMVRTDLLTGVANRYGFQQSLAERLDEVRRSDETSYALMFIDLDGFKAVNDALGHHAGDAVLKAVAERLRSSVRHQDVVARLAGDEFAILLKDVSSAQTVRKIAENLLSALRRPIEVDEQGSTARISASIGIYIHMPGEHDASRVLSMADHAMYEAKRRGKNRFVLFEESMWSDLQASQNLSIQLEKALSNRAFDVFLQPICTPDGTVVSSEALARWRHEGEWISPAVFIPLMEKRGLVQLLTEQILEKVAQLLDQDEQIPCVSVNLSLQPFYDAHFMQRIEALKTQYPGVQGRLGFEITESMLNSDMKRIRKQLLQMQEMGFRISIDDFGTGYSSFAYIRDLPANVLKIDRSFVTPIQSDEQALKLLTGMIALAHELELNVVIEGVESQEQIQLIQAHSDKPFFVQGFVFYRPFPMTAWRTHLG